jgi:hypothetical protein
VPSPFVVALGPAVTRARVLVHEVARAEDLTERRRAHSADHARLEVEEHHAGHVLAARGLVVKNVGAVELCVVVAAVLAVAADPLLVENRWRAGVFLANQRETEVLLPLQP